MSLAESITGIAGTVLDKFVEDKDLKAKLQHEMNMQLHNANLAQIELNKNDAQGNWFQSSWRPLTGYVCVLGFGVNFLVSPIAAGFGVVIPQADTSTMMPVLMGLLGLGGLRSFEKTKGVEGK
jgi:hypothetical protein|tara:strand:+ start:460 stop:828 length:369 start_codon:yes stop_codon:yes gene_type:complete